MSKKDLEFLKKYKQSYDEMPVPEKDIDKAIQSGLKRAKQEKVNKPRKSWLLAVAIVAILLVGYVSSLQIIDFIRDDRGLVDAVESNYYQEINASSPVKEGVRFVVDGVIADEYGLVVFYTIHSDEARDRMTIRNVQLTQEGKEVKYSTMGEGMPKATEHRGKFSGMIEYYFRDLLDISSFKLGVEVVGSRGDKSSGTAFNDHFEVPFELTKELLTAKTVELNEAISVDEQEFTIKKIVTYPLRIAVHLEINPENTKRILGFKLRLFDEAGEIWGSIQNGVISQQFEQNEQVIYLQSNYFHDPEELYLEIEEIQMIDQEERYVMIDLKKEEIIRQPKEEYLQSVEADGRYVVFQLNKDHNNMPQQHSPINFGEILNEHDEELQSPASFYYRDEISIRIDHYDEHDGLIFLEITKYPRWTDHNLQIQIYE